MKTETKTDPRTSHGEILKVDFCKTDGGEIQNAFVACQAGSQPHNTEQDGCTTRVEWNANYKLQEQRNGK